jgi:iron complex transport system permease protein
MIGGKGEFDPSGDMTKRDFVLGRYRNYVGMKVLFIAVCIVVALLVAGYAITVGSFPIGFWESYQLIWDHIMGNPMDPTKDLIVWETRLPRVITGAIVGIGLAACGAVMQSMMKNPLADPYTTGISSGASFGATVAILFSFSFIPGVYSTVIDAFVFSLVPAAIIIIISGMRHASPSTMILAGIAVMYIFNAFTTVFMLLADPEDLAAVYTWQVGTLGKSQWGYIPVMAAVTVIGVVILQVISDKINLLSTGDESAKSMGVDADKLRIFCLIIVSLVAASIVSFTGIIGFVGLVCPHVVRLFIGSDNKYLIPASAAFGVVLVLVSDIVGRTLLYPVVLQVGVVTAFLGGPLFLYLLIRSRKEVWRWAWSWKGSRSPTGEGRTYCATSPSPSTSRVLYA